MEVLANITLILFSVSEGQTVSALTRLKATNNSVCPSLIDLFITVICLDSCSSKAAEDSLDKASSLTPPDLRKTQLGAQRIFFHHCFFLFFQPLAQPFIALRASVCHLAAVDKQSQI